MKFLGAVVNPFALKVRESDDDLIDGLRSKDWDEFARPGAPEMDFVLMLWDDAAAGMCPVWPCQSLTAPWGIEDLAAGTGSDIEKQGFRPGFQIHQEPAERILSLPLRRIDTLLLDQRLRDIGRREGSTWRQGRPANAIR